MRNMILIQNVKYAIPYSDTILEDLSLEVKEKDFMGIIGHNGSGKTTLMDLLMGFRSVTSGTLSVIDEDPHELHRKNKNQIAFLSQDVNIKGNITIADFLKFQSILYPQYSKEDEKYLLYVFDLNPEQKVGVLSLGQQKKLQIIAGFSARPKLLLIDEITAVLDPETREVFFRELDYLRNKYGTTVILATNIAEDLVGRADTALFISGKKATLHSPAEILRLFNLEAAA